MTEGEWKNLTNKQQHVMALSMYLRNAMEDFHVRHLSDDQMAELNPILRQALFDFFTLFGDEDADRRTRGLEYLVDMIPPYWEVPDKLSFKRGKFRQNDSFVA